jgi:type VI secretion system protein VasD
MCRVFAVLLVLAAGALAACADKPPPPATLDLTLNAAPSINPSLDNRPSPVSVRIYELTSLSNFQGAPFFNLLEGDVAALGPELMGKEEVVIAPGATRNVKKELKPTTRFIGLVAFFRDYESGIWRAQAEVKPNQENKLVAEVQTRSIAVAEAGK